MQASKQLFTLISSDAQLKVSLNDVDVPEPKAHEVIVKIEAAPINPSDMWECLPTRKPGLTYIMLVK